MIARCRFYRDVSANIDIFLKNTIQKHQFSLQKRTRTKLQSDINFDAFFCHPSRGLLLDREAHFLKDVLSEITILAMPIVEFCAKYEAEWGPKKGQKKTLNFV